MKLYYEILNKWVDSEKIFISLFDKKNNTFWIDSSRVEEGLSRFSYMGESQKIYSYTLTRNKENVFDYLQKQLQKLETKSNLPFDFIGGFIGYFGYELKALTGSKNNFISDYPDSMWFFVDRFLAFDHKERKIYAVCLTNKKNSAKEWFIKIRKNVKQVSLTVHISNSSKPQVNQSVIFNLARSHKQYLNDIAICKKYLTRGESYQICLTNTVTASLSVDPLVLYINLREKNPAPFSAFFKHNNLVILCSSPERFLHIDSDMNVEAKPIKGTIKRSLDPKEDQELAKLLLKSEKDRAENLMITDLLRNDLGKVCEIGSITVPKLISLESYQTVHQLVSTIHGKLQKGKSASDCIKACFPGGSMTGAPKIRTMGLIEKLEKKPRGIYSGSFGFLSVNGAVDLNIIIRTIVKKGNMLTIGAGGGILIQSDPEKEYQEMLLKAKILLEIITHTVGVKKYILRES